MFPLSPRADQFQWGGGVVASFFPVAAGRDLSNSLKSGAFSDISRAPADHPPFMDTRGNSGTVGRSAYTFKERNHINSLQKNYIYQKFGGGHGPPGYATVSTGGINQAV